MFTNQIHFGAKRITKKGVICSVKLNVSFIFEILTVHQDNEGLLDKIQPNKIDRQLVLHASYDIRDL